MVFRMVLASFGASTPFITSRPSNAMTLASVAEEVRLGLAGADAASALFEFASGGFAIFASLLSAKTGATEMANTSRVDKDFLSVNMDGGSWFSRLVNSLARNMERNRTSTLQRVSREFATIVAATAA